MNDKRCRSGFKILLLSGVLLFFAPKSQGISLNEVLLSVEKEYPLLRASEAEIDSARGNVRATLGAFDLKIKGKAENVFDGYYETYRLDSFLEKPLGPLGSRIFAGYRTGRGNFAVYDGKAETNSGGEWRLGMDFNLLRDSFTDKRRTDLGKARVGLTLSELLWTESLISNQSKAAQLYYEWIAAGQKKFVFQQLLDTAIKRDDILKTQAKRGEVARFDQRDNERLVLARRASLVSQERKVIESAYKLSLYYRDDRGQPMLPRSESLQPFDFKEELIPLSVRMFDRADQQGVWFLGRPEIAKFQLRLESNELEYDLQRNQLLPKLEVQFTAAKDLGDGSSTRKPQEMIGALNFEIPIQNRGADGRMQSAAAIRRALEFQYRFAIDRTRASIKDAIIALDKFKERFQFAKEEYAIAQELELGEQKRFRQGASNLIFVNIREQQAAEAAVKVIDARLDYMLVYNDLLALTSLRRFGDSEEQLRVE